MRHKESKNPSIKAAKKCPFWQNEHLVHMEVTEVTFALQASIAWTKCIGFQTMMLEKRRKVTLFFWHSRFSPCLFLLVSFGLSPKSLRALSCLRIWGWGCRCPWERCLHGVSAFFIFYTPHRQLVCSSLPFTPGPSCWAEERSGTGTSRALFICPLFTTCLPGSSCLGSACLSSLDQLTCRHPNHRQSHWFETILQ